jgi:signal peptidase I
MKFPRFTGIEAKAPKSAFARKWNKLKKNIFVSLLIDLFVIIGSALVLSLILKTFLIRSFFIPSGSMMNTLQIDDRIIVNQLVPDLIPVERGDIVVFKDPGGWLGTIEEQPKDFFASTAEFFLSAFGLAAPDSSQHLVKRVIGISGDNVVCCDADGKLQINGVSITEPYIADGVKPSETEFNVTVPEGSIWVMGDNRPNSEDSRYHLELPSKGFVSKEYIVGKAFVLSWPFAHWTWLGNYPDVFKDVPKP